MTKRTKWLIGIAIFLATSAILTPIIFYIVDFHALKRATDPKDWGPFGDYIGGILNPILSLLTLIVTVIIAVIINRIENRNHDEAIHSGVKPLFTIWQGDFFSSNIQVNGLTVEKDYYDYEVPQRAAGPHDYLNRRLFLKLSNKGLGIATNINVTFELNLETLKPLLVTDVPQIRTTMGQLIQQDDGRHVATVGIASGQFNYHGSFRVWSKETHGIGVLDKGEEAQAFIPNQMIATFKLYNLMRRIRPNIDNFPSIHVTLNYKNIHGKEITSKYELALTHRHDYPNYSLFAIAYREA